MVGVGMMLGAHVSSRTRSEIEHADVVFVLVSDPIVELWLQEMRPDMRSLQSYYSFDKRRTRSYAEMVAAMLAEVRSGRRVCGVFYGHPGVFAQVPHSAVKAARHEGFDAEMLPGVSAEDCLYADLGIDPGRFGCQHYEATQFMLFKRVVDPSAYLVLWQIATAGDLGVTFRQAGQDQRRLLLELLAHQGYPDTHGCILYEAATLPIMSPRMDWMTLADLTHVELNNHSTLVIPPARPMEPDPETRARLQAMS